VAQVPKNNILVLHSQLEILKSVLILITS